MQLLSGRKIQKSVLCVDLDRRLFYLNELQNGRVMIIPEIPQVALHDQNALQKLNQESAYLYDLVYDLAHVKYDISKEDRVLPEVKEGNKIIRFRHDQPHTEYYRKRKLPVYFLSIDRSDYPMFYSRDNLAIGYLIRNIRTDDQTEQVATSITVVIRLENYTDLLEKPTKGTGTKRKLKQIMNEYNLDVKLSLLSSVNENMKKIVYEAYFKYGIELKRREPEKYFGLKVDLSQQSYSRNEYFYGDIPLISFFCVQDAVRFNLTLELVVEEIPYEGTNFKAFPNVVEMPFNADLQDFYNVFNWNTVSENPMVFWPLPKDLSDFRIGEGISRVNEGFKPIFVVPKKEHVFIKPRALIYQDSIEFSQIRIELIRQQKLPLVINRLYTGEITFVFRFKILGASSIESLFYYLDSDIYYNGTLMPVYVTHWLFKKVEKQGKKRIVEYLQPISKLSDTGKFARGYDYKGVREFMDLNLLDFTPKGSVQLEDLKKYFKLPFKPYLVFIEALVLLGDKPLIELTSTTPVPFCNNPKFDFPVKLDKIKVCELPLEVLAAHPGATRVQPQGRLDQRRRPHHRLRHAQPVQQRRQTRHRPAARERLALLLHRVLLQRHGRFLWQT